LIPHFTGIDDPYEPPTRAELEVDTHGQSPEEAAQRILLKLENLGLIA
jgi:adenylylsulfate kinase-like enzyme